MMFDAMMEATFYSITLDVGLHVDYLNQLLTLLHCF